MLSGLIQRSMEAYKRRAHGDDFRTFLGHLVAALPQSDFPTELSR